MNKFLGSVFSPKEIWMTEKFYANVKEWFTQEFLSVIILTLGFIITLIVYSLVIRRVRRSILKRAEKITVKKNDPKGAETVKRLTTLIGIVELGGKLVLWFIFILMFLNKVGVNIAPILTSAGILGLAIGFGAQELVRDFISGFFILLEDQVRVGDVAVINGTGGLVEKIALRTITLRDFSGVVHIFQNGKINSLSNMTKEWSAMVFDVGVAYKEDTDRVLEVMRNIGEEMASDPEWSEKIIEPIEIFGLDRFADSALVMKARLKTLPIEQWAVGREYRRRLKAAFDQKGIEIPFPHTTVYWGEKINPLKIEGK